MAATTRSGGNKKGQQPAPQKENGAPQKENGDTNPDHEAMKKENEALKSRLAAMAEREKLRESGAKGPKSTEDSAMSREVKRVSKQNLWKRCKFLKNTRFLDKAVRFVMGQLDLKEFDGLKGADLSTAMERFANKHKDDVRLALNRQRNYVQGELREVMMKVFKEKREAEFPNGEQMKWVVLREKMDDKTPDAEREKYYVFLVNVWRFLMPKVATHKNFGPNRRNYGLMSTMGDNLEDLNPGDDGWEDTKCSVTASDEAFLLTVFTNCYHKWWYEEVCRREGKKPEATDRSMRTPFTNPKAGQKKFGGWTNEGISFYGNWTTKIKKNRVDNAEYIQGVEELALQRVKAAEEIGEDGDKKPAAKNANGKRPRAQEEEEVDENDFEAW